MIRAFIFDLDGTLYPKSDNLYMAMSSSITRWFKKHLAARSEDFANFYEEMKQLYPSPLGAIQAFGLDVDSYEKEVFEEIDPKHYLFEDASVKSTFSLLAGKKFLVTLSSRSHTEKVLHALEVGQYFSEIYNPGNNWNTCNKIDAYEKIRTECELSPEEICVVGDSYLVDLQDAEMAGYVCILVSEEQQHVIVPTISSLKQLPVITNTFNETQQNKE